MTRYARIDEADRCVEFIDFAPQGRFHPSIRWLSIPESLESWANEDYIANGDAIEPPSLDYLRDQLKERLAGIRFERETQGVTLPDGSTVLTDRGSQAQLGNAYQSLSQPFVETVDWKGPDGWVSVTEVELRPVAEAVARHVQGCFTAERRVSEQQIDAASTVDDLLAIDLEVAFAAELEAIKAA